MEEYFNNITQELDKYLADDHKISLEYGLHTYIIRYMDGDNGIWLIRFPGATRGYVKVNEDFVIEEIKIYDDAINGNGIGCYEESVKDIVKKYIGQNLILELCEDM